MTSMFSKKKKKSRRKTGRGGKCIITKRIGCVSSFSNFRNVFLFFLLLQKLIFRGKKKEKIFVSWALRYCRYSHNFGCLLLPGTISATLVSDDLTTCKEEDNSPQRSLVSNCGRQLVKQSSLALLPVDGHSGQDIPRSWTNEHLREGHRQALQGRQGHRRVSATTLPVHVLTRVS